VVAGPAISGHVEDYAVSYRINGNEPVQIAGGLPSFGAGAALKGDIVRLLQSLPGWYRRPTFLPHRWDPWGVFFSNGLKVVREKPAAACKWPQAIAKPGNWWSSNRNLSQEYA
jgi:hypothetical protein